MPMTLETVEPVFVRLRDYVLRDLETWKPPLLGFASGFSTTLLSETTST